MTNTPQDATPVAPGSANAGDPGSTRFDGLDYRALQKEAADFDDVAGNLPEVELRAALIEADRRRSESTTSTEGSVDEQLARRDRQRAAAGEPTSAERAAAVEEASSSTPRTISPGDAIRSTMEKLEDSRTRARR